MTDEDRVHDAIVVGSGAGGLAAAAALSLRGLDVMVLEAMPELGGYLNPFQRCGYRFDVGMHYLGQVGEHGLFRALLERLGVWGKVGFHEIAPSGFIRFVCGDLELALPAGRDAMEDTLCCRFPAERAAIRRFMNAVGSINRKVEAAVQMSLGLGSWLRALPYLPELERLSRMTFFDLVSSLTSDPQLQAVLCMMNCGLPPQRAAAVVPALIWHHYLGGAFYPRGGSGALRDALVQVVTEAGNALCSRTRVLSIRREGELFAVIGGEQCRRARCVICNADPTLLYGQLLEPALVSERLRQRVAWIVPSISAFYASVATDLDLPSLGITSATIQHTDSIAAMVRHGLDVDHGFESYLLSCTTLKDPAGGHAPPGQHVVGLVAPAPFEPFAKWACLPSMRRGEDYVHFKTGLGWRLIEQAERYVPGLASHTRYVDFATPVTNLYWVNAPAGGCYGPAHLPSQVGRCRFGIKSPVPGLFLCGAGTLAGGVYPSMRSGEIAAALTLRFLRTSWRR